MRHPILPLFLALTLAACETTSQNAPDTTAQAEENAQRLGKQQGEQQGNQLGEQNATGSTTAAPSEGGDQANANQYFQPGQYVDLGLPPIAKTYPLEPLQAAPSQAPSSAQIVSTNNNLPATEAAGATNRQTNSPTQQSPLDQKGALDKTAQDFARHLRGTAPAPSTAASRQIGGRTPAPSTAPIPRAAPATMPTPSRTASQVSSISAQTSDLGALNAEQRLARRLAAEQRAKQQQLTQPQARLAAAPTNAPATLRSVLGDVAKQPAPTATEAPVEPTPAADPRTQMVDPAAYQAAFKRKLQTPIKPVSKPTRTPITTTATPAGTQVQPATKRRRVRALTDQRSILAYVEEGQVEKLEALAAEANARNLFNFVGQPGYSPLTLALTRNDRATALLILNTGVDVNLNARGGYTPLHAACYAGDLDMVKRLLARGAKVNAKDFGMGMVTPLIQASFVVDAKDKAEEQRRTEIIRLLLAHKADVKISTDMKQNALLKPAANGYTEAVTLLAKAGTNINQRTAQAGFTPLIVATMNNHEATVKQLLKLGANPKLPNKFKQTARQIAKKKGYNNLVKILAQAERSYRKR